MTDMRVVVVGAAGRMGRMLVQALHDADGVALCAALEQPGSIALGQDAGLLAGAGRSGVLITDDPLQAMLAADAVIDFTTPQTSVEIAALAAQARIIHIIGTTGFNEADLAAIAAAARHAVIVRAGNMSLGVTVLAALVARVAATLDIGYDIEIVEMHHRHKVDAPSGTALLLGEAAAQGRKVALAEHVSHERRLGARVPGSIGFASLRGGTVIGDHAVIFAGAGERIELTHRADDRAIFARGAVKAVLWGRDRKPGQYTMADVLGLKDSASL